MNHKIISSIIFSLFCAYNTYCMENETPVATSTVASQKSDAWGTYKIKPLQDWNVGITTGMHWVNYIPLNATCSKNDTYLLAHKKNNLNIKKIFKLTPLKSKENELGYAGEWDIRSRLDKERAPNNILFIHAIPEGLLAIIQDGNKPDYSIGYINPNVPLWKIIYPPEGTPKEKRKLLRLSGNSLNKIWVTFEINENHTKSFFISQLPYEKITKNIWGTASKEKAVGYNASDEENYRTVDQYDTHMWAITNNNELIYTDQNNNSEQKSLTNKIIASMETISVSPQNELYGFSRKQVYKWDNISAKFQPLKTLRKKSFKIDNPLYYACFNKNKNYLYVVDENAQIHRLVDKPRKASNVFAPSPTIATPPSAENKELDLPKSSMLILPDESSSEEASDDSNNIDSSSMVTAQSSSSSEGTEINNPVENIPAEFKIPKDTSIFPEKSSFKKNMFKHYEYDKPYSASTTIEHPIAEEAKTKPSSEFHKLSRYTEKAEEYKNKVKQKWYPSLTDSSITLESARNKFAPLIGLTGAASALGWAMGYGPAMQMIKYPFIVAAASGIPAGIYVGWQEWQSAYLKRTSTHASKWSNDLAILKTKTYPSPFKIAGKEYYLSNEFDNDNPEKPTHNREFYLTPKDTHLVDTFQKVVNALSQKYEKEINYVAIRPVPGVPRTDSRWLPGDVLPSIIVATKLTNDLSKSDTVFNAINNATKDIPSTHYQPLFSTKVYNSDLIYTSTKSLNQAIEDRKNRPWWWQTINRPIKTNSPSDPQASLLTPTFLEEEDVGTIISANNILRLTE